MLEVKVDPLSKVFLLQNDCCLIDKKNTLAKTSESENGLKLKLFEENEDETLWIQCVTKRDDCGLIGCECKNNYDCRKAVDFCYIYFSVANDSAVCHLYDIKKTVAKVDVIKHLVEQWCNSIRYAKSVCAYYNTNIQSLFLGVVTELFDEECIRRTIAEYVSLEGNVEGSRVPSMVKNNMKKNFRYIPRMRSILELFVQKKMSLDSEIYDFRCFNCENKEYHMIFTNGIL